MASSRSERNCILFKPEISAVDLNSSSQQILIVSSSGMLLKSELMSKEDIQSSEFWKRISLANENVSFTVYFKGRNFRGQKLSRSLKNAKFLTKTFAFFDFKNKFSGKNFRVFQNIFRFYVKKGRKTQKKW